MKKTKYGMQPETANIVINGIIKIISIIVTTGLIAGGSVMCALNLPEIGGTLVGLGTTALASVLGIELNNKIKKTKVN